MSFTNIGSMSFATIFGILVGIGVLVGVVNFQIEAKKKRRQKAASYTQRPVMTATERRLYYTLATAVGGEFLLFAQVQLTGFIRPAGRGDDYTALNKIHRKSVDFLLCDRSGNAVVAIELQDWTHNRADRQRADAVKAAALESAGVPLIEFHAQNLPSVTEISEKLRRFKSNEELPTVRQG